MEVYYNYKKKRKQKRSLDGASRDKKEIISMTNYEKTKTMFFRINDQHVDRLPSTIDVVDGQRCEQHCTPYPWIW